MKFFKSWLHCIFSFFLFTFCPKTAVFFQILVRQRKKKKEKTKKKQRNKKNIIIYFTNIAPSGLEFLLDPELRGRSTGSIYSYSWIIRINNK